MGPPYKKRRLESGRIKADQIRATGARMIIVPCHNCYDQIGDLSKEYDLGVQVKSFKEIITESMILPERFRPRDDEDMEETGEPDA